MVMPERSLVEGSPEDQLWSREEIREKLRERLQRDGLLVPPKESGNPEREELVDDELPLVKLRGVGNELSGVRGTSSSSSATTKKTLSTASLPSSAPFTPIPVVNPGENVSGDKKTTRVRGNLFTQDGRMARARKRQQREEFWTQWEALRIKDAKRELEERLKKLGPIGQVKTAVKDLQTKSLTFATPVPQAVRQGLSKLDYLNKTQKRLAQEFYQLVAGLALKRRGKPRGPHKINNLEELAEAGRVYTPIEAEVTMWVLGPTSNLRFSAEMAALLTRARKRKGVLEQAQQELVLARRAKLEKGFLDKVCCMAPVEYEVPLREAINQLGGSEALAQTSPLAKEEAQDFINKYNNYLKSVGIEREGNQPAVWFEDGFIRMTPQAYSRLVYLVNSLRLPPANRERSINWREIAQILNNLGRKGLANIQLAHLAEFFPEDEEMVPLFLREELGNAACYLRTIIFLAQQAVSEATDADFKPWQINAAILRQQDERLQKRVARAVLEWNIINKEVIVPGRGGYLTLAGPISHLMVRPYHGKLTTVQEVLPKDLREIIYVTALTMIINDARLEEYRLRFPQGTSGKGITDEAENIIRTLLIPNRDEPMMSRVSSQLAAVAGYLGEKQIGLPFTDALATALETGISEEDGLQQVQASLTELKGIVNNQMALEPCQAIVSLDRLVDGFLVLQQSVPGSRLAESYFQTLAKVLAQGIVYLGLPDNIEKPVGIKQVGKIAADFSGALAEVLTPQQAALLVSEIVEALAADNSTINPSKELTAVRKGEVKEAITPLARKAYQDPEQVGITSRAIAKIIEKVVIALQGPTFTKELARFTGDIVESSREEQTSIFARLLKLIQALPDDPIFPQKMEFRGSDLEPGDELTNLLTFNGFRKGGAVSFFANPSVRWSPEAASLVGEGIAGERVVTQKLAAVAVITGLAKVLLRHVRSEEEANKKIGFALGDNYRHTMALHDQWSEYSSSPVEESSAEALAALEEIKGQAVMMRQRIMELEGVKKRFLQMANILWQGVGGTRVVLELPGDLSNGDIVRLNFVAEPSLPEGLVKLVRRREISDDNLLELLSLMSTKDKEGDDKAKINQRRLVARVLRRL